jgi:hypothetical protein
MNNLRDKVKEAILSATRTKGFSDEVIAQAAIDTALDALVSDESVSVMRETYANKTGIRCDSLALRAALTAAADRLRKTFPHAKNPLDTGDKGA